MEIFAYLPIMEINGQFEVIRDNFGDDSLMFTGCIEMQLKKCCWIAYCK